MTWEYLQTPELDKRFITASKFVGDNLVVADLNAGSCRFSNYIKYKTYFANEIDPSYDPGGDIVFLPISDEEMVDYLRDKKIDLLCLWGHGAGHLYENKFESPTLTDSFLKIAENNAPGQLIIEASEKYENKYGPLREIISKLDYEVTGKFVAFAEGEYGNRVGYVLTNQSP